ncbi:unnamed protein product [Brassicogethes aeneus]|uniref:Uncharacterized protein n=1 Tax=Brassicogethes aeneus TaxID=1431903 RepID=A0A9P0AX37_BRAAE|nr:unnamed protein product [Brassicogethes aeneus]
MNGEEPKEIEMISISDICRLCANQSEKLIGIYTEDGCSNDLANKMNLYLPIKISETDDLPLQCCWQCASTLLAWHDLVVTTADTDRKLRSCQLVTEKQLLENIYQDTVISEEPSTESISGESNHDENRTKNLFCKFCQENFEHEYLLKKHIKLCHENYETTCNYYCDICKKGYKRKYDLKLHNAKNHTNEDFGLSCHNKNDVIEKTETDENSENDKNKIYFDNVDLQNIICKLCNSKFKQKTLLKNHMLDSHNIKFQRVRRKRNEIGFNFFCEICNKGFTRKFDMETHTKSQHTNVKVDFNPSTRSLNVETLNKCKITDGQEAYYKCDFCGHCFKRSYHLMRHRTIHTGERSYFCHICGKNFRLSTYLKVHIQCFHFGYKRFNCSECSKKFASKSSLTEHMNIHFNRRPFTCEICGKTFRQHSSLKVHKIFHNDDLPFSCTICSKRFKRAQQLKIHVYTHTGEKPYKCKVCEKSFRLSSNLKRHQDCHNKSAFKCEVCACSFSHLKYLNVHRTTHEQI